MSTKRQFYRSALPTLRRGRILSV